MNPILTTVIFFAFLILILYIGLKKGINFAVLAIPVAFLVGAVFLQMAPSKIIGYFPTSLFFNYFISTLFFGFAACNDTLKKVAQHLVYALRNKKAIMPIVVYLVTVVVSALGAAAVSTPLIMSAISFSIALQLGYDPILASLAVGCGAVGGSNMPWSANHAKYIGQYSEFIGMEKAVQAADAISVWTLIIYTGIFMLAYLIYKGWKVNGDHEVIIERPEPMNKDQRFTLNVLIGFIALLMVPIIIESFASNPITKWMTTYLNAQCLMAIGAAIFALAKIAPVDKVFKEKVPFGIILLFCGMTMYMKLANDLGVLDVMTGLLTKGNLPPWLITGAFCLVCAILTMFVDGKAVSAFFIPLVPVFAAAAGVPEGTFVICIIACLGSPGMSPFSTGGAMSMLGCPDELKMVITPKQFKFVCTVIIPFVVLMGALGLYSIGLS